MNAVYDTRECGNHFVSDGIGSDYESWQPSKPIFISAPTGKGKNTFIYDKIVPYVDQENYDNRTANRILILSNRQALKQQVERLSKGTGSLDDEFFRDVKPCVDVMTYQSLLGRAEYLKAQQHTDDSYAFVICDEAHFFTSDALFNVDTKSILDLIPRLFPNAVRVYMSATLDASADAIFASENSELQGAYEAHQNAVEYYEDPTLHDTVRHKVYKNEEDLINKNGRIPLWYKFSGSYDYLNVHSFHDFEEDFLSEIVEGIVNGEKWIIFVDDKDEIRQIKDNLDHILQTKGSDRKVLAASAESKGSREFQELVLNEKLPENVYALITTAVLDNGVNINGIDNIVVTSLDEVQCRQMVGRARVKKGEKKDLYIKQHTIREITDLNNQNKRRIVAYHAYDLAYDEDHRYTSSAKTEFPEFFLSYFHGSKSNVLLGRHLFKPTVSAVHEKDKWDNSKLKHFSIDVTYNSLARAKANANKLFYASLLAEMEEEKKNKTPIGESFLNRQYAWFGKVFDPVTDAYVSATGKEKFLAFLEEMVMTERSIVKERTDETPENCLTSVEFWEAFRPLYEAVYGRFDDRNVFGKDKINTRLAEKGIPYRIDGPQQKGPWKVVRVDTDTETVLDRE